MADLERSPSRRDFSFGADRHALDSARFSHFDRPCKMGNPIGQDRAASRDPARRAAAPESAFIERRESRVGPEGIFSALFELSWS